MLIMVLLFKYSWSFSIEIDNFVLIHISVVKKNILLSLEQSSLLDFLGGFTYIVN